MVTDHPIRYERIMTMTTISFDYSKLNKKDQRSYDNMNEAEKASFERIWIQMETQKLRLDQCRNASKLRTQREKRFLAEKRKKERVHRLIQRGAILESFIDDAAELSNEDIKELIATAFNTDRMKQYIADLRIGKDYHNEGQEVAIEDNKDKYAFF